MTIQFLYTSGNCCFGYNLFVLDLLFIKYLIEKIKKFPNLPSNGRLARPLLNPEPRDPIKLSKYMEYQGLMITEGV